MNNKLVVILGPTACGKTRLAVELARKYNGEIVSADSRQVYRGMDIGTGKDLKEYGIPFDSAPLRSGNKPYRLSEVRPRRTKSKAFIPYHLIDIASPKSQFNVGRYQKMAYRAIDDILKRGKIPFLVGGTGLYIQAIVDGLVFPKAKANKKLRAKLARLSLKQLLAKLKTIDFKTWQTIDKNNRRRIERALEICLVTGSPLSAQRQKNPPPYDILQIGVALPKKQLHIKIDKRLKERLGEIRPSPYSSPRRGEETTQKPSPLAGEGRVRGKRDGLIEEVARLHKQGLSWKRLDEFGLEYRSIGRYLQKKLTYDEMVKELSHAIKNFAKRQMTWFSAHGGSASGGKRDQRIHWTTTKKSAQGLIKKFLQTFPS